MSKLTPVEKIIKFLPKLKEAEMQKIIAEIKALRHRRRNVVNGKLDL